MLLGNQGRMTFSAKLKLKRVDMVKVEKAFTIFKSISNSFFTCLERTTIFIYLEQYKEAVPQIWSLKKCVLLQICNIITKEYPCRSVISRKLKSHFCKGFLLQTG